MSGIEHIEHLFVEARMSESQLQMTSVGEFLDRFLNSLHRTGRSLLAQAFLPGCSDLEIASLEVELQRPVQGDLLDLLRITKGARFDRAAPWDQYHMIPPEVPLELELSVLEMRNPDRCIDVRDYPLLSAVDNIFLVQQANGAIVRCEPGGGRELMFDNIRTLLETSTQAHEDGIFLVNPDQTVDYELNAYVKLGARLNPASSYWRS